MVSAFILSQQSNSLAAAASKLIAATTVVDFEQVRGEIDYERALFEEALEELLRQGGGGGVDDIPGVVDALFNNILAIENSAEESFELKEHGRRLRGEILELQRELERRITQAIDDQFFFAVTGYRQLGRPPVARDSHFTEAEFQRFRYLMDLERTGNFGTQILASTFNISDPHQLEPVRERFEVAVAGFNRNLDNIGDSVARLYDLRGGYDKLVHLGIAEVFVLRVRALSLAESQERLLVENRRLSSNLASIIAQNLGLAREMSESATSDVSRAVDTARNLLLWINLVGVTGALAAALFYVGGLVGRINALSGKMRDMAAGDLDSAVEMGGRDEVAEMADALEVFRRRSLEARRLNMVEELAGELSRKNEDLEQVLDELKNAQDQIVMREKLAALGELTAGVAHEIKNPLNFVKNFAEGSIELVGELREITDGDSRELSDEQKRLLNDIGADLAENMSTILRNGERANRIVQDMLGMGRGSDDFQAVNINSLVMEHVNLAYHTARAADSNFLLTIEEDLDPAAGEITVIPHDLGRVFLNMVSNACYATDEKRKLVEARTGEKLVAGDSRYTPTIGVSTRRDEDYMTVTIRDNGCGIPEKNLGNIFNPFFTTKPPDKGTGLGLALSNDIVVQHGGFIKVSTEAGEYTEMVVVLPLSPIEVN